MSSSSGVLLRVRQKKKIPRFFKNLWTEHFDCLFLAAIQLTDHQEKKNKVWKRKSNICGEDMASASDIHFYSFFFRVRWERYGNRIRHEGRL